MSTELNKHYFEFVGPHTSGKTTLIKYIVDQNLLKPKISFYPQKIQRSKIKFAFKFPFYFCANIKKILFLFYFIFKNVKLSYINYHAALRHLFKMIILHPYYCREYEFDIFFKDDMLHLLPRLHFKDDVDVSVAFKQYFNFFSKWYSGIIHIDLPYDVMIERFNQRFSKRDIERKKNRIPVYERAFAQNKILRQVLIEQESVPILCISGVDSISENVYKITNFVKMKLNEK